MVKKLKKTPLYKRFFPRKEHYEAQKWCFNKGFKISIDILKRNKVPTGMCRIKITQGKAVTYGKKEYVINSDEFTDAIWHLYLEVYEKYKHKL